MVGCIFTGCFRERIELDLNQGNNVRLAVEGWITDLDEVQTVILSTSSDYFDTFEQTAVTDATVTLSFDNEEVVMTHTEAGVYEAPENWRAIPEKNYTLTIEYEGEEYTASSYMEDMSPIENPYADIYEIEDDTVYYDIYFSFQETPGEGNGYFGVDYKKGIPNWNLTTGGFTNDEFLDGLYFEDVSVTGESYFVGDTVILEVFSIGIEASNFLFDIQSEVFREGLFDPPPVNIRSNISNGALGYFIASGAERAEVIVE